MNVNAQEFDSKNSVSVEANVLFAFVFVFTNLVTYRENGKTNIKID